MALGILRGSKGITIKRLDGAVGNEHGCITLSYSENHGQWIKTTQVVSNIAFDNETL